MKKLLYLFIFCSLLTGCGKKEDTQQEISGQVLRFHVRAASDAKEDQKLKLQVKTQVLSYLQWLLADCSSKENCMKKIEKNLVQIEKTADAVCQREGKTLESRAYLTKESFPLKQYGDMVLPGGMYDALRVDLGKAEGKNWWCMMYPSLCMVDGVVEEVPKDSKEQLQQNLSQEAYDSLFWTQESKTKEERRTERKYHVKWKIIESFEKYFGKKGT